MTCSKLTSGRAVLIGDAAHSVSPNIGMGCSAAMQDSEVLSRACIAAGGDVEASAARFNTDRLANAHALTLVSQRVDTVSTYQYHNNLAGVVAALPYKIAQSAARIPASIPVPGALSRASPAFLGQSSGKRVGAASWCWHSVISRCSCSAQMTSQCSTLYYA